jgi:hypothetical protein
MGGIALSTAVQVFNFLEEWPSCNEIFQALHHRLGLPYATEPISTPEPVRAFPSFKLRNSDSI